ncbi:hypothetical protein ES703_112148 [subsurface metagenome]
MAVNLSVRAENPLGQLLTGHFQAEKGHRKSHVGDNMFSDIEGQGGLAHCGPGGEDDHIPLLQSAEHLVELGERSGQAGDPGAVILLDLLEDLLEKLLEGHGLRGNLHSGDLENAALGFFEDFLGVFFGLVSAGDNLGRGGNEFAQQGKVANDVGVIDGVGTVRDALDNSQEVGDAADLLQLGPAVELFAQEDQVEGLLVIVKLANDVENGLVVGEVKTVAVDDLNDLADLIAVEDHRSQQTSLGVQRLGRQAFGINGRGFDIGIGHANVLSVRPAVLDSPKSQSEQAS